MDVVKKDGDTDSQKTEHQLMSNIELNQRLGDRIAILISNVFGSITFLCCCGIFFTIWIVWNLNYLPGVQPFDRFPFPVLEMVVSIFAIILSVSVLISQNRQGRMEKVRQLVEFEVNVRAENEITKMLEMLHEIQKKIGINNKDNELEAMKENLDIQQLHKEMNDNKDLI